MKTGMKPGDRIIFLMHSYYANWRGAPKKSPRLSFYPSYLPKNKSAIVSRVKGRFFFVTAFPTLCAPISAVEIVKVRPKKKAAKRG